MKFQEGDEKKWVFELLDIKDKKEFMKQYLSVLYILAKCEGIITNIDCGAYHYATLMKYGKYEVNRNLAEENNMK